MAGPDEGPEGDAPAKKSKIKEAAPQEEKIDSVLHVDRTVAPVHPEWMKAPLHPELELKGPAEYDLKTNMDISFLPGQGDDKFTGLDAYEHLKSNNLLDGCLGVLRTAMPFAKEAPRPSANSSRRRTAPSSRYGPRSLPTKTASSAFRWPYRSSAKWRSARATSASSGRNIARWYASKPERSKCLRRACLRYGGAAS